MEVKSKSICIQDRIEHINLGMACIVVRIACNNICTMAHFKHNEWA